MEMQASNYKENKLRWYPQQPQRFIFTNLSEACCETKRWKPFEQVRFNRVPEIPEKVPGSPGAKPCWTWPGASQTFSGTFSGTLLNLLNLTWLCTRASWNLLWNFRNPVEPDLSLHQILDLLGNLRNLLRNLVELDPVPAPVHRSYSGLKTPSAYAVGDKLRTFALIHVGQNLWKFKILGHGKSIENKENQ